MNAPRTITGLHARALLSAAHCDDCLIGLGRALDELHGGLDWPYFLGKPYKWAAEYAAWVNAGSPSDDGSDGWEAFQTAVNG